MQQYYYNDPTEQIPTLIVMYVLRLKEFKCKFFFFLFIKENFSSGATLMQQAIVEYFTDYRI